MANALILKWQDIHFDTIALAKMVEERGWLEDCKGVIAVARGGLIPAGLFCNATGIKTVECICLSSYNAKNQSDIEVVKGLEIADGGKGWIIVDDLVDTGNSFAFLKMALPNAHRVCLYAKPQGAPNTEIYVREIAQDCWLHFPWELDTEGRAFEAAE
jgi:xanthine phosphoribosyltransferase